MPITEARRAHRMVQLALVGGALSLIATVGASTASITVVDRALVELRREHDRIDRLEELRVNILVARAEHRAFLLDNRPQTRERYLAAERSAAALLDTLRESTLDDPPFELVVDSLRMRLDSSATVRRRSADARATGLANALIVFTDPQSVRVRSQLDTSLSTLQARGAKRLHDVRARWELAGDVERWSVYGTLAVLALSISIGLFTLRREAQHAARSEARYVALTDDSPDFIIVQVNGTIRYANRAAHTLMRVADATTLVGRPFFELLHPEDRAIAQERAQRVVELDERPAPQVLRFRRGDGSYLDGEVRAFRVIFDNAPAGHVIIRDVNDLHEAERALAASERRYRALLDEMAEGVILADTQLVAQLWNPAAEHILGLTNDQMAGLSAYDPAWGIVDEDGTPIPVQQRFAATALRTGKRANGVMGVDRPDGSRVWVYVSAMPLRREGANEPYAVELTFSDVTAEREASRKISESEARYRLLAENSVDLISRRSLDHRFEYVSPSHEIVLGWRAEEMLGHTADEFMHPDDVKRLAGRFAATSHGLPVSTATLRVRHKDGHYLWLEGLTKPIVDEAGAPIGYQVSARDISARHALEEQLRQSQKLEAMGRMASGVAHDFNNLLTVMRASADMLDDATLEPADRQVVQQEVTSAIARATALTAQLLAFSRGRHSAPEHIRVASLLHNVAPLLARLCGDRLTIGVRVNPDADHAVIDADPVQVEQVLFNLVVNARDAMADGGHVEVACGMAVLDAPRVHRHGTIPAGAYVTLHVRDEGNGMSDDVQAHLFEPFFTTKPQGKGTGLGLSTVFGIVRQSEGAITLDSEVGRGCLVTVYWPMANTTDVTPASVPVVAERPSSAVPVEKINDPRPILVVDDEPVVGTMIGRLLGRQGYTVVVESSALDSLDALRREPHRYCLMITDVRMPQLSGIDLARKLIDAAIDVPVLFVSAQLDGPFPSNWPSHFAFRFLGKPFTVEALAREVEALTATRRPGTPE